MNILVTANCFPPGVGGTEVYSHELALGLSRQPDTHVHVLAPCYPESAAWDAGHSLNITRYRSRFELAYHYFSLLWSKKIDKVYVTHRAHYLTLAAISRWLFKIPFWITIHGTEHFAPHKLKGIVKKITKARKIIATSQFIKQKLLDFGVAGSKITIIPPTIDTTRFHPEIDSSFLKQKYGLKGKKVLVTLCRLVPEKGVDHVIEALAKVRSKLPPFHYFVLGKGPEEPTLKDLVKAKGLEEQVTFPGAVPHARLTQKEGAFLNLADVYILTSHEEPFGICYLEAGACGKPSIAYRSGGVVDILCHEQTGLLVPPGNINEAGDAIERLLNDPEYARQLGARARERVVNLFSTESIYKKIWSFLGSTDV